jgi:uncharacterized protein YbjT (DUF2867 family)
VVAVLSQWLADPLHPAIHAREKWLTQQVMAWIPGVDVVTVNPGFFADNYMVALEPIAQFGLMAMPLGEGQNAPLQRGHRARDRRRTHEPPARTSARVYRPIGPAAARARRIAAIMARARPQGPISGRR